MAAVIHASGHGSEFSADRGECVAAMSRMPTGSPKPPTAARAQHSAQEMEHALAAIVRSDEPAVVLSSLARCSSPAFSDACSLQLSVGVDDLFEVSFPVYEATDAEGPESAERGVSAPRTVGRAITTSFKGASAYGYPAFAGVVVHSWAGRDPAEVDRIIARLLVDRALAIVQQERLAQSAALAEERATKLALELITSRTEGEAFGILMTQHGVTRTEAAILLRRMSRLSGRPLREAAAHVVHAGSPERSLDISASSAGCQQLHIAASNGRTVGTGSPERRR
jgi:ANTAR domain